LEKEASPVLNEILAKLDRNEKLIGAGAVVFLVAWLFGIILASWSYGSPPYSFSENVFSASGGTGLGILGVLGAVAAIAVIYLKYAPNMKITWPAPVEVVELGIAAVVGLVALYLLWTNFSNSSITNVCNGVAGCPSWPMTDWIAVIGVVVGAAVMLLGAYQEWAVTKKAAA
jgi:hypothetical protein